VEIVATMGTYLTRTHAAPHRTFTRDKRR
jgi:hypothetical protein